MPMLTADTIQPTPSNFAVAESGLLQQTGGQEVLWVGRAATALQVAYEMAKVRRPDVTEPEVIVPAMMCATAANTAVLTGMKPRFADVGADSGLITLESVQERFSAKTVAVVAIHLLGHTVAMDALKQWCDENNLLLIEDPTQALGAKFSDGRYTGSVGDVAVYSFNRTKIIEAGNGVLVVNSAEMTDLLEQVLAEKSLSVLQLSPDETAQLGLSYRNLHHSLVGLLRMRAVSVADVSAGFMRVQPAFLPMYTRAANPDIDLNTAWETLPQMLAQRLLLAEGYAERLEGGAWQLLTGFRQSGVCWRFSLLLHDERNQVTFSEAVRRDGFHVSNLYWPVNQFFRPEDSCPGADSFGRRIVNLWVDPRVPGVDEAYVERCCDS
ncbi:MAG: DegT/DnrJ/EryC1/StrS aminotransferase family protein, partial [Anaerolineae bacterium]|nr:DegT/DnrJ/EryC1/StrS aminotransferase family protein [Anaerolineae bacterium]